MSVLLMSTVGYSIYCRFMCVERPNEMNEENAEKERIKDPGAGRKSFK